MSGATKAIVVYQPWATPECGERGRFDLGTVQTPACPNRACDVEYFRVAS